MKYYVPQNINRGYSIGSFRISGIFEGLILGFLMFHLVGLVPIPYPEVLLVFQIAFALGIFFVAAKGFFTYTLTETCIIMVKYLFHRSRIHYRRAFRLEKANSKTTEDFTQGLVIEKEFGDRVVKLKDGRYVSAVEIPPINFFTRTEEDKNSLIRDFTDKFKTLPIKGQIVSYTSMADPYSYIDYIKSFKYLPENKALKTEYDDYEYLCRTRIGNRTLRQRFVVVFTSDALDQVYRTEAEKIVGLKKCANDLIDFFSSVAQSENEVDPFKYQRSVTKLLFDVYNPLAKVLSKNAFTERENKVDHIFKLYDNQIEKDEIPLSYYLAPRGFDDKTSSKYVVAGESFYSFFYIAQNTYPIHGITSGWLASQYQNSGVDYHLFYQQITDSSYINKLNMATNISRNVVNAQERDSQLKTDITSVHEAATYLKQCLLNGDEPYYMGVMISLHSNDLQRLFDMEDELMKRMRPQNVKVVPCRFLEKEAYMATRLGNQVPKVLWKKMRQNVPASSLAAMFPFASTTLGDTNGIYIGNSDGKAINLDLFDTSRHTNANLGLFGSSGGGKTFAMQAIAERERLTGKEVFIITPTKGDEYDGLIKAMNGNTIRINSTTGETINVMEIYPPLREVDNLSSLLYKKVESINAFIRFRMPDMTPVESQILDGCTIATFERFGITKDNESLWQDKSNHIKKKMPKIGDLVMTIEEYAKADSAAKNLATIMQAFTTGSLSFFNNESNIDLSAGMTLFDMSGLSASTKTIAMFAVTELIQSYFEQDRSVFKMLMVDEVWMLLENQGAANAVVEWAKTIRGKSGSLCFATQELSDLYRARNGVTLCTQAPTKILLPMTDDDVKITGEIINLTDPIRDAIRNKPKGEGVLMSNGASVSIKILASGHNTLTYTTDPNLVNIRNTIRNDKERKEVERLLDNNKKPEEIKTFIVKYRQTNADPKEIIEETKKEKTKTAKPPKRSANKNLSEIKPPKRTAKPPKRFENNQDQKQGDE